MAMGHRERVIKTLRHEDPDRVPLDLGGTDYSTIHIEKYRELKAHFGVEDEDTIAGKVLQTAIVHEPILQSLDIDFRYVVPGPPERSPSLPVSEDSFRDKWGVLWRKPPGSLYHDVESP